MAPGNGTKPTPALFLHGYSSGLTPVGGGAHLWGDVLKSFAAEREVMAPDLPGSGKMPCPAGPAPINQVPTIDTLGKHVQSLIEAKGAGPLHIVGHDDGGLVALWLALNAPHTLKSVSVVASRTAAPAGDGMPVLVLNNPPTPLYGKLSQAWVFEQISYTYAHVTDAFLDTCVAAAQDQAQRAVLEQRAKDPASRSAFGESAAKTRTQLFRLYREKGVPCPVQLVWGSHDPLTTLDRGFGMYEIIAKKQPSTRFDVMNRVGNLPFREEPRAFFDVVGAFHAGVDEARGAKAA